MLTPICSSSEQKIDDIARGIDGIKLLLKGLNLPAATAAREQLATPSKLQEDVNELVEPLIGTRSSSALSGEPLWDHSAHIVDFVKSVLDDRRSKIAVHEADEVFSSLQKLVHALEDPSGARAASNTRSKPVQRWGSPCMPPLEAVVAVLRWAKSWSFLTNARTRLLIGNLDHEEFTRVQWISQILPLQTFTDICQRVYFSIDDYSEIDYILANAYLSYIFSEHVVLSGLHEYRIHSQLCRENLGDALARLPFLLSATLETIAALTLAVGALHRSRNGDRLLTHDLDIQCGRKFKSHGCLEISLNCFRLLPNIRISPRPSCS